MKKSRKKRHKEEFLQLSSLLFKWFFFFVRSFVELIYSYGAVALIFEEFFFVLCKKLKVI